MPDLLDQWQESPGSDIYTELMEQPEVSVPLTTKSGKIDGRSRAARQANGRSSQAPSPRRVSEGRPSRAKAKDYRPGIAGIAQLGGGALMFVSPADAAAVLMHAGSDGKGNYAPIPEALNDLAQQDPRFAAILDRLLQVGPYGALLAAVMPLVLQVLTNHGKLPAGMLGTMAPDQLVEALLGQAMPQ